MTKQPSKFLLAFLILPIIGTVFAFVYDWTSSNADFYPRLPVDVRVENATRREYPAPAFTITDRVGNPVTLDDYAGQTVLINFWQTTCIPCTREMPAFMEYLELMGENGPTLLAINFDETTTQIESFFDENRIEGIPVALDPSSQVRRTYGVAQIPTTFVVDAEGNVRFQHLGEMTLQDMLRLVEETDLKFQNE